MLARRHDDAENDKQGVVWFRVRAADRYKAVGAQTMWGIHVVVICRLALVGRLSNIQTDLCKQGKSKNVGLGGNKGAVACSFTVDGATRVCFVNAHLVARCERLHKPVACFATSLLLDFLRTFSC